MLRTIAPAGLDARPHVLGEVLEASIARVPGAAAPETLEELPHLRDDRREDALRPNLRNEVFQCSGNRL